MESSSGPWERRAQKGSSWTSSFRIPRVPKEDKALAEAIREYRNVVLAADIEIVRTREIQPEHADHAHRRASLMREHGSGYPRSRWIRTTWSGASSGEPRKVPPWRCRPWRCWAFQEKKMCARMVHFAGPAQSFPYAPYYQALDPERHLPEGFFKDKIVLVGKALPGEERVLFRCDGKIQTSPPTPQSGEGSGHVCHALLHHGQQALPRNRDSCQHAPVAHQGRWPETLEDRWSGHTVGLALRLPHPRQSELEPSQERWGESYLSALSISSSRIFCSAGMGSSCLLPHRSVPSSSISYHRVS